jgi:hypothetical protein
MRSRPYRRLQFAGIASVHAAGASDLVMRNVNTGAFEVYDIANNQNHWGRRQVSAAAVAQRTA